MTTKQQQKNLFVEVTTSETFHYLQPEVLLTNQYPEMPSDLERRGMNSGPSAGT